MVTATPGKSRTILASSVTSEVPIDLARATNRQIVSRPAARMSVPR